MDYFTSLPTIPTKKYFWKPELIKRYYTRVLLQAFQILIHSQNDSG